jgi:lipopolysaccharide biosynthesis protein
VWYVEVLEEILRALEASNISWRIVLTTTHERAAAVRERLAALGTNAELCVFENRGRDILPFLHVANRLLDEGVETVLKLHTKRSVHRRNGEDWRRELLNALVAPQRARALSTTFATEPGLGLIAADGHFQPLGPYLGANRDTVSYLTRRLGLTEPDSEHDGFVAGSMFWARLEALRPLLDAHLSECEFESEAGQLDGTFAHAVERIFARVAAHAGFRTAEASELLGLPASTQPFPYASADPQR